MFYTESNPRLRPMALIIWPQSWQCSICWTIRLGISHMFFSIRFFSEINSALKFQGGDNLLKNSKLNIMWFWKKIYCVVNKWSHGLRKGFQGFCDDSTKALVSKSVTLGEGGVWAKMSDIIYRRPLYTFLYVFKKTVRTFEPSFN